MMNLHKVSPRRFPVVIEQFNAPHDEPDVQPDDAVTAFRLIGHAQEAGLRAALITVIRVHGGSARGMGAHMAVVEDGRYCGYVSGGCVEAAVAAEALRALKAGADQVIRFGVGSPFFDIRLPCGGGIDVHIHVRPDPKVIQAASRATRTRETLTLVVDPAHSLVVVDPQGAGPAHTSWRDGKFYRIYAPRARLVLIGRGLELEVTAKVAVSAGFEVYAYCVDSESIDAVRGYGAKAEPITASGERDLAIDAWSAVIFLFHDHDLEFGLLRQVLERHAPFFIGALGSRHTHRLRVEALARSGLPNEVIARIHGPVGLFGPTRDAASLALSILAQVAQTREATTQRNWIP